MQKVKKSIFHSFELVQKPYFKTLITSRLKQTKLQKGKEQLTQQAEHQKDTNIIKLKALFVFIKYINL